MKRPQGWAAVKKWAKPRAGQLPETPVPVVHRHRKDFDAPPEGGLRLTWFGHSSVLIELDGHRFLTDPLWGKRCGPLSFIGPKRFFEPPMPISELPRLDAVVLSHDHYDHLDAFSVRQLEVQKPRYVVPLGVGAHLEKLGVDSDRITELDWWQHATVGQVQVWATPARHYSGRMPWDRNASLWASFSWVGPKHRVFFSGDSGMHPDFAEIGCQLGPFDVTLMESGSYDALWADVHMGPEQAVRAHQMLQGRLLVPVHWGTFKLALHSWVEPVERIRAASERAGVTVAFPRPGESVEPTKSIPTTPWWPKVPWRTAEEEPVRSTGMSSVVF